jgi:hypothetical protein
MARKGMTGNHFCVVPAVASDAVVVRPLESPVGDCTVSLEDILETVEEFGSASLDLVAWEFSVPVAELTERWDQAVGAQLLRPAGTSQGAGEQMYEVAKPGHMALRTSAHRIA